jgi:nitrate/nitrite transporter NarK
MQLDDLRHQWQQPEPAASAALTPAQLSALLTRQRGGLVDKMRRNARFEAFVAALVTVIAIVLLSEAPEIRFLLYATLLIMLGLLYFYYRMLSVLRQMSETDNSIRSHLVQLYTGLRKLLHIYYQLSVASVPVIYISVYVPMVVSDLLTKHFIEKRLLLMGVAVLVVGALTQVLVMQVTHWYSQRLYGQHLDRLESQLRELDEPAPHTAQS